MLDPESPDAEVVLAAAYNLACILAVEPLRESREGDWDAVARKVATIREIVDAISETRTALSVIERKAHDAGVAADKRHASLVRLVAELSAIVDGR